MYLPKHFALEDRAALLELLRSTPFGHLVTGGGGPGDELCATALPFLIDDQLSTVRAHFSRANHHWKSIDGADALLIVPTADAYVSPRWYRSKAEHGKVVPTWNYEVIHVRGTLEVHHSESWKLSLVSNLTDHNEAELGVVAEAEPWRVSDAPDDFVAGQLKAIVGVQLNVTEIVGKQKLSQNRSDQDRKGAMLGLAESARPGDLETAKKMSATD